MRDKIAADKSGKDVETKHFDSSLMLLPKLWSFCSIETKLLKGVKSDVIYEK